MSADKIESLLLHEIQANKSLDRLIDQILSTEDPQEGLEVCKRLANELPEPDLNIVTALEYSRYMRSTLNEDEFRWLQPQLDRSSKQTRRACIATYRRVKELFDIEITISRRQKRASMALARDWSGLGLYLRESLTIARYRLLLTLAGVLFITGIPGARDLCDAAVFGIFRTVYLPAA